ncbi:MAG: hypothetical protein V3U07_08730 [Nitrospirales bacterium]
MAHLLSVTGFPSFNVVLKDFGHLTFSAGVFTILHRAWGWDPGQGHISSPS